jgi:hypothetical protein
LVQTGRVSHEIPLRDPIEPQLVSNAVVELRRLWWLVDGDPLIRLHHVNSHGERNTRLAENVETHALYVPTTMRADNSIQLWGCARVLTGGALLCSPGAHAMEIQSINANSKFNESDAEGGTRMHGHRKRG